MELDGTQLIDSTGLMDKGFLSEQQRTVMKAIVKQGSTQQRLERQINAVLLLDKGWSCADVVEPPFLDDDTIRGFYRSGFDGAVAL